MLAILLYNEYIIWNKWCEIMPEIFGIKYNEPEILPLEYIMREGIRSDDDNAADFEFRGIVKKCAVGEYPKSRIGRSQAA